MDRNIQRCKRCGAIFNSYMTDHCANCTQELDEYLTKIQDYLFDHGNAGVIEIATALEINEKIVLDFLRSGELTLEEGSSVVFCDNCNKPIRSGRYCNECTSRLGDLFGGVLESHKKEEQHTEKRQGTRMHIRHKDDNR